MAIKSLRAVTIARNRSVIRASFDGPVLRSKSGDDYTCPHCGSLLATSIRYGQVYDIVLECHKCGKLSAFPALPRKESLTGGWVAFPAGVYAISSLIDFAANWVGVGRDGKLPKGDNVKAGPLPS